MRRYILLATLVGLGVAATASEASAQRRGWAWGNRNGGFAVTPGYIGPYTNSGYNSGYFNSGNYYSNYPNSGYSNGYYYSQYPNYNSGYTYNTYPSQSYYYNTPRYYNTPGVTYSQPGVTYSTSGYTPQYNNNSITPASYATTESNNAAFVRVIVPTGETQLWLGATKTESQGMERTFQSPALDPGKDYTYTVKARWMSDGKEVEQTRDVKVQANMTSFVDFRLPATTPAPMPDRR